MVTEDSTPLKLLLIQYYCKLWKLSPCHSLFPCGITTTSWLYSFLSKLFLHDYFSPCAHFHALNFAKLLLRPARHNDKRHAGITAQELISVRTSTLLIIPLLLDLVSSCHPPQVVGDTLLPFPRSTSFPLLFSKLFLFSYFICSFSRCRGRVGASRTGEAMPASCLCPSTDKWPWVPNLLASVDCKMGQ